MLFEYEPSGINDTYLRITRNGLSCILVPAGAWNGLVRLNYLVAGAIGGADPHMVFRCLDVGWDDGRFFWKGKAAPVLASTAMVDVLIERGLVSDGEAETLVFGAPSGASSNGADEALMLKASIMGCSFTPLYDSKPGSTATPEVTGFALRTLSDPVTYVVEAQGGLPKLTPEARDALKRQVG